MADQQATFAINLEDGTSGPAGKAASALASLRQSIDGDTKALAGMNKAMKNLKLATTPNTTQIAELQKKIDESKASIAAAQSAYLGLGGSFTRTGGGARGLAERFAELQKASQSVPGPLGGVVSQVGALRGMLAGGVIALGILAIASAMAAVVAASVVATASLLKYGIAQADARRSELLRLEGLTKMRNWYGLAAGNAGEMQAAVDRVSASVALGRGKVAEYSTQLYKMGLRGENLTAALEGVAIKSTVQGEAAAMAFAGWAAGAARTGQSVRKLSDDVKARLGGIAAKQMLSLSVQSEKLHESFAALFSGLRVEGLLTALNSVTSLFSQNTASGRALKALMEAMLQPLIGAAEKAGPLLKRFFQGIVIGALFVTVQLLQVRNWFRKAFGDSEILKGIDAQRLAVYAGIAVVGGFVGVLTACAVAVAALGAAVAVAVAPFYLMYKSIELSISAISSLFDLWQSTDWASLGTSIAGGIVKGLKSGTQWVIDSIKGLGAAAMGAFKSALGIHSPSRVFAKFGLAISEGVGVGVDRGAPGVNRAVGDMVSVPAEAASSPAAGTSSSTNSSSRSVSVGEIHIHTTAEKAPAIAQDIKRELERILEGVVASMAAPVPGAA